MQNDPFNRPSSASKNPCILLVEDNGTIQLAYQFFIQACGYEYHHAGTGQAALDALTHHRYAAIVLDYGLPDMTGEDILVAIREQEKTTGQHIPILINSAHGDQTIFENCRQKGADMTLTKPVTLAQFREILPKLIALHQEGQ